MAWVVTLLFLEETVPSPTPIREFFGFKKKRVESILEPQGEGAPISTFFPPAAKITQPNDELEAKRPLPLRALLTRPVIIAAGNYASLSLVEISFRAIQPLFLSTPIHLGGLGLPPSSIGNMLSIYGILNGVFQVFFFAKINDRWGSKRVFFWGLACALPAFASFPVINYLARHQGYSTTVWIAVGFQTVIPIALSLCFG